MGQYFTCLFDGLRPVIGQDDESAEEVQRQLEREWGTVSVENEQADYEVDTAQLQAKVRPAVGLDLARVTNDLHHGALSLTDSASTACGVLIRSFDPFKRFPSSQPGRSLAYPARLRQRVEFMSTPVAASEMSKPFLKEQHWVDVLCS